MDKELEDNRSYEENAAIVRQRNRDLESKRKIKDHNDLSKKVKISINTTMIGALEAFEENFKDLWEDEKHTIEISGQEFKDRFLKARQAILDKGNTAVEKAKYHLNRFEVKSKEQGNKFNIKMRVSSDD